MNYRKVLRAGLMNDDPYDPKWHMTKVKSKIKDIIRGGEEAMLEIEINGRTIRSMLISELVGQTVWVGDEEILIEED